MVTVAAQMICPERINTDYDEIDVALLGSTREYNQGREQQQ